MKFMEKEPQREGLERFRPGVPLREAKEYMHAPEIAWLEVYDREKRDGKLSRVQLGGWDFEYAVVSSDQDWKEPGQNSEGDEYLYAPTMAQILIERDEETHKNGTHLFGRAFVFEKDVPIDFRDYVGLHENIETRIFHYLGINNKETSDGEDMQLAHSVACFAELSAIEELDNFPQYLEWMRSVVWDEDGKIKDENLSYFRGVDEDFAKYILETDDEVAVVFRKYKEQLERDLSKILKKEEDEGKSLLEVIRDMVREVTD